MTQMTTAQSAQPDTAQELTLRVYVNTENNGKRTEFALATNNHLLGCVYDYGTKIIASILAWNVYKECRTYPDAVEFIGDCIEHHFDLYGINVEFV